MNPENNPGKVFNEWAKGSQASGMEDCHWPVVKQAFSQIPEAQGNYLEIGVGNGYGLHHMATNQFRSGTCYGIDIAQGMVDLTAMRLQDLPNVHVEHGDFMEWEPPSGTDFTLIFSMEVFYYFPSIQSGIEKAFSLLKPGGQLWVMVDFFSENESVHDWPEQLGTAMELWSMEGYRLGMEKAGFTQVTQQIFTDPNKSPDQIEPTLCTVGIKT